MTHRLTAEQQAIVAFSGTMKVNAVAGSGKTSVIFEHNRQRKRSGKALYLVFNRAAREEAHQKARQSDCGNLTVATAHSLAYRYMGIHSSNLCAGYTPIKLRQCLNLAGKYNLQAELILAGHILKLTALYCNSSANKVRDINYMAHLTNEQSLQYAADFYDQIYAGARQFLTLMYRGTIPMVHDFYLKIFQLSLPKLDFERIYFDESQDASEVMLDVVKRQNADKIFVGDSNQRIYGWRYAVNSMEDISGKHFNLTGSFRFGGEIAREAKSVLKWKEKFTLGSGIPEIIGLRNQAAPVASSAFLARSNIGILDSAVRKVENESAVSRFYFEGGFNSYLFGSENTSVYDVLHLYNGNPSKIRDGFVKNFPTFDDLKNYVECADDSEMRLILDLVEKYSTDLFSLITKIKKRLVSVEERRNADFIFSTVHRCKGLEYDQVTLANDFVREKDIARLIAKPDEGSLERAEEEINILYVAITRCRQVLHYEGKTVS